ncbi:hypothetical protein [Streptomyces nigra]|uniref:hypothetical protein n=1 Tax=Streptomyces nigra TaxID=1827580 RepID=UPI00363ECDE7
MQPFAPLGRVVVSRGQKCGHSPGDTEATDCPDDATWHILWTPEGDAGLACDPHMAVARERFVFVDSHPVGSDCGRPGAHWSLHNQRCVLPDEPAAQSAAAEQPATV